MTETGNTSGTREANGSAVPTKSTTVGSRDVRVTFSVAAAYGGKDTWVHARERRLGIEIGKDRITDDPTLSPAQARQLARALYRLAARVEKRLVEVQNAADAEAPPVTESRDEARQEGQAPSQPSVGTNGVHLLKAAG